MNINEIAKIAGVSRATVSRYLNHGYVSEEKREQIRKVIEETGYKPSVQAQMLRTKKTRLIGVIIPKINSESIGHMVSGISEVLSKEGFQLLLANTDNNEKEELKYLKLFAENQVDGIILIGTVFTKEHRSLLKAMKVPVVILGQRLPGYSSVSYDDYGAARELTQRLLDTGKMLGYIGVNVKDEAAGLGRRNGFLAAAAERKAAVPEGRMLESPFTMEGGYEKMKQLYEEYPDIGAVFCATDTIAVGAMTYLHEQGKRIPEDVALAGIGDSAITRAVIPKLTTVHYYYRTSGIEAANMLVEALQSEKAVKKEVKMGYDVIERESIG